MPNTAHERINRIARHLSASGKGAARTGSSSVAMNSASDARPPITSHALDTATGKPAEGLPLKLEYLAEAGDGGGKRAWMVLGSTTANSDGRAPRLLAARTDVTSGTYRMTFDTEAYFRLIGAPCFYPEVTIVFRVEDPTEHFHIPLLISPFGYSTYRGS